MTSSPPIPNEVPLPETAAPESDASEQALARARTAAQAKRVHEALGICDDLLAADPGLAAALALKGTVKAQAGHVEEAVSLLESAVAGMPGVGGWHANLCALYRLVNRCDDAVRAGREAVRINANSPQFLLNLALALTDIDERDQALVCLLRAVGHAPQDAAAHLALAQILLARGEYDPGWLEYEWRNETEAARGTLPRMTSAAWNGMNLPGRVVLVGDQGYGDTIQFARYIPMVAERCTEVVVGCSPELVPLLSAVPGVTACMHRWDKIPGHAAHARMSSLPYLMHTRAATIPSDIPYLRPEAERLEAWGTQLDAQLGRGARIGFAWAGRPTHPNDRRRSMPLSRFKALFDAAPDACFVSLQKPLCELDRQTLESLPNVTELSPALTDFGETAAIISHLDLVVTIDTAIGHLAGALGRPVWLMLAKPADWRWLLERPDSPWYPSMRLFRQAVPGEWDDVVHTVSDALAHGFASNTWSAA